jgi:hypothetical protein
VNVTYMAPLRRAWARTKRMLFRPARLETWLVLGFAAWISEFLSGGHTGGQYTWHRDRAREIGERIMEFLHNPVVIASAAAIGIVLVVVFIVLLWVSSRGKFIFLDNVVSERPGIVEPWKRFKRQGNSLFIWSLLFGLACLALFAVIALPFIVALRALWSEGAFHWAALGGLVGLVAMLVPIMIVLAFISLYLSDFVVPIMYKHDLSASAAWGRFLALFRQHPGSFVLYGLFVFVLWLVAILAMMVVGFSTCCIGFVLLALPYVGSVVLLPVYVTFRGLGPEFLAQFGPDYELFAAPAAGPPPAASSAAPPIGGATS